MARLASIARLCRQGRWQLAGAAAASLVAALVPAGQIRGGAATLNGLIGSYMYEVDTEVPSNASIALTDLSLPSMFRVDWDYNRLGSGSPTFWLTIPPYGTRTTTVTTHEYGYTDNIPVQVGTSYTYSLGVADESGPVLIGPDGRPLPLPPAGADPRQIYYRTYTDMASVALTFTPQQSVATDAQAVDSRLDTRYSSFHLLDHQFGDMNYRGGLYAGYASDNSRVGRSFTKFQMTPLGAGSYIYTGGVFAWSTRSLASGSTTVGCQAVPTAWDGSSIRWSTAPTLDPTAALTTSTITWDASNPSGMWGSWKMTKEVGSSLAADGLLAVGFASTSEASNGWAYFARPSYDASLAPRTIYTPGAPLSVVMLSVDRATVTGGQNVTGWFRLNAPAPSAGATVSLALAGFGGAQVSVPAGTSSGTFSVATSSVSASVATTLTAYCLEGKQQDPAHTVRRSAAVTVTP